ncbi:MAG: hypothetical protein GX660_25855 [Clostridiaceae bacterium]|nr:hypothetical protein [Clostridiaceae bacterium]
MVSKFKRLANIRVQPLMPMGKALDGDDELFPTEDDYRQIIRFIEEYNFQNTKGTKAIIEWGDPIDHLRRFNTVEFQQVSLAEIKSDGSLSVSSYLPLRVGNLKKHTLKEYWNAGLGRVWSMPIVKELSERVLSIGDMRLDDDNIPTTFFEDNLMIDIIEDKPFANLNKCTLNNLYRKVSNA